MEDERQRVAEWRTRNPEKYAEQVRRYNQRKRQRLAKDQKNVVESV
jgi:hypothetical protein